nr:S-layer homology domain-containing protein [Butyricicoccus sp. AF15-40]
MKRRLLSAFLAVMMVLTMAPVAFAADGVEPTDGTGSSEAAPAKTLQKQIDEAENGATITLNDNYTEDITIPADKVITLNLNDKKLTNVQSDTITVTKGAKLTIEGAGTVDNVTHAKSALVNYGEVVLNNGVTLERSSEKGTLSPYSPGGNSCYTILNDKGATMTINDATVKNNGGFSSAIRNGGDENCNDASNLTINDGNFSGGINSVKNDECGILTINGGTFSNTSQYVIMNWNKATINNGTFSVKDSADAVLFTAAYRANRAVGELIVNNGTFTGNGSQKMVENHYGSSYTGTASITGGTFSSDVSAYCDANYATEKNTDNTYTVKPLKDVAVAKIGDTYYKTLADAVAAAQDGDTITLLKDTIGSGIGTYKNPGKDLQGNDQITAKGFTIDFNQHTYSVDKPAVGSKTYETQGFHFEWKGAVDTTPNITLKNGTLNVAKVHDPNLKLLVQNYCNLTLDNMTVDGTNLTKGWGSYTYVTSNCNGTVTIKDSAIISENPNADVAFDVDGARRGYGPVKLTIEGDSKISGKFEVSTNEGNSLTVKGGYFTTDPSAYVASGYVAGTSDVSGYSYKVVAKTNTGNVEVKPDVADPEVTVSGSISEEDKKKVENAAKTVSAPTLGAETGDIVKDINEDTAKTLIEKATTVQGNNKKLYVQSSLKVEPTAYNETTKTLALKITPQYRIVASTAATADDIELGDNGKNAEVVQDYQPMNITKATVVTMELPTGFAVADGAKLSIKHTKSNGKVEYYTGTVTKKDNKLYLTFTTNGFSPFVISVPAAAIESKVYPTLQAAVDSAKNGDIIDLYKDVAADTKVTVAKSIKFTVNTDGKKFDAAKNIVAGSNTTVKVTGESSPYTYEFTYTKPSSGSSSGGSSSGKTTYKVTTSAVNNGGVNASPSNAEKGATITITLSPDKGYKLDKLTVTDGSGKTVSTVKKSDTVYTFTMPASAVKVGVSYVKATETPSETKFNDVSANDWFASAVDYVTGKGMMNGTADNTFSPKANTTRGMVVTVLYRLENQPSTSAASFTDVASGAYYANAVAWANANGIVSGYGSGKFGPNDKVTREQLAAILYRYAQYKKYDVSGANSLDGYTDVQSVSSYAVPALQWANAAGVVTGKSGSKLDPKGYATRAEVAAMLMRFCENVK